MNTTDPHLVRVEVAADLPVLWATRARLDLPATLERFANAWHTHSDPGTTP
jgi:hypothetical protein